MADVLDMDYPFTGRWLVQNSPANRVPSHGTRLFATSYAIDFVPVDDSGRSAPFTFGSLLRPEPPENFVGFGRSVLSPVAGTVVASHDTERDHLSYRGMSSIGYTLTQKRRAEAGWLALAGNHVMIRCDGGVVVLCHLQRRSTRVRVGQHVEIGEEIGLCGNSGNSTEPHVHVQAIDSVDIDNAAAVPITFNGAMPSNRGIVTV
ncbi:M23 family peptidase [Brevibacterium aurantiacum]|uniref:M23 family peptidase n=1 Tax=Brevibacterium aurantiacum TaxID=273384 RepID=A0A3Q9NQ50_BREAU|nr:M23 family metallopeptidase [Brevibacterium aurantiacum]AZL12102.1 M23 family peptidase [Brevibacterium aurantiacum]AZT92474.1 M23 family peptidase [Brevibacterium aurantiacum]